MNDTSSVPQHEVPPQRPNKDLRSVLLMGDGGHIASSLFAGLPGRGFRVTGMPGSGPLPAELSTFGAVVLSASQGVEGGCEGIDAERMCKLVDACAVAETFVIYLSSDEVFERGSLQRKVADTPSPSSQNGTAHYYVEQHIARVQPALGCSLRIPAALESALGATGERQIVAAERLLDTIHLLLERRHPGLFQLGARSAEQDADTAALVSHLPADLCHACLTGALQVSSHRGQMGTVSSDCFPNTYRPVLAQCEQCGLVQKVSDLDFFRAADAIYRQYNIYTQGDGAEQRVFDGQGGQSSRSDRIFEALSATGYLKESGTLLDFGCGNGAFLKAFGARRPQWRLFGKEFNDTHKVAIEAIPNATFVSDDLDPSMHRLDLIAMIHCLEHIVNPVPFLKSLASLINPGGRLFVQVPNVNDSPFDLMIADHCSHFSPDTIRDLLQVAGYRVDFISDSVVKKELSVLASPIVAAKQAVLSVLEMQAAFLSALARAADSIDEPVAIFGSSIAASWLSSNISAPVRFFVDEDTNRIGREHIGIPIVSVDQLPAGIAVLMPMSRNVAESIVRRIGDNRVRFILPPAAGGAA